MLGLSEELYKLEGTIFHSVCQSEDCNFLVAHSHYRPVLQVVSCNLLIFTLRAHAQQGVK